MNEKKPKQFDDTTLQVDTHALKKRARDRRDEPPSCPYLLFITGKNRHKKVLLLATRTLIGRDPTCHIHVEDSFVSAQHLALVRTVQGVIAEDLASANGTHVNSSKLHGSRLLKSGDRLYFGNTELEFVVPEDC
ncbi:MAG: FHA domain-containing protein [Candidatus Lernaella stagnicola]|nr:FHA domain-containing protein [Candidatus Lernaella stagnicola]